MQTCANGNAVSYIIEAKENPETNYRRVMLTFFNLQKADVVTKEEAAGSTDARRWWTATIPTQARVAFPMNEGDQDDGMVISTMLSISGVQDVEQRRGRARRQSQA